MREIRLLQSFQLRRFEIRRVYASNLVEEFNFINSFVDRYPIIALDTEFPGVCFKSPKPFYSLSPHETYEMMKANINKMKMIQLGIALFDIHGNLPDFGTHGRVQFVWEFNFKDFNICHDLCDPKSVNLLLENGIDFHKNSQEGIDSSLFAEVFAKSGLFKCPFRNWVTFHGAYDLGYLLKVLNFGKLPNSIEEFLDCLRYVFGDVIFDMKQMMLASYGFTGGLEKLAKSLSVQRIAGQSHRAGSDCLLTALTFTMMLNNLFSADHGVKYGGLFEAITGYGLDGGIDLLKQLMWVLNDIVGKVESNIPEDDL